MRIALLAIRHYSQVQFNLADWSAQDPNIANLGLWTALKSYSHMASLYLKGQAGPQQGLLSTPSTQLHSATNSLQSHAATFATWASTITRSYLERLSPGMWWIQTKQGSKRWLESLHLCLDLSRSYKRNQKSVNLALHRKQATLVYWMMNSENYFFKKALQKLKNLSKKMNIRRFHFRKMVFCTTNKGY